MTSDPGHDSVEILKRLGFGRGRPAHNDDFDPKRTRRLDLGVSRAAAAVLGHQRLDPLVAHKGGFVGERKRSALKDQLAIRQGVDLRGPVDRPNNVPMLRGSREGGELQPALGEKDCSCGIPENLDGLLDCRDLDPAIAGLACPGWASEGEKRCVRCSTSCERVRGHLRGERMGGVDDRGNALTDEKRRQTFDAAETSEALRNRRLSGIGGRPRERQHGRNTGLISKPPRQRARLRRAAENKQTQTLQGAAP